MIRMETGKIILKELSYELNGILFQVNNKIGRYGREKQYGDLLKSYLKAASIKFEREYALPVFGVNNSRTNVADFLIEDQIVLDLKAKPVVLREDYDQIQKYLQAGGYKLGLIINFRNRYLKPIRVIRLNS